QFKSDSPRLASLVWVKFSVYGVQVECRGSVAHTLIGRYALGGNLLDLLKKVVLINLSAALVVIALAQFVPFFATTQLVDFLFFVV
ncbi:hypothetical protein CGH27_25625, partial [Vibrio parahaemolyticus]